MGPVANKAAKGQANRKMRKRLERRLMDYSQMISKSRQDGWSGFKRPGSNTK